jgi:hypothetical protein
MTTPEIIHQILTQINILLYVVTGTGAYMCWQMARHLNADSLEHKELTQVGLGLTVLSLYILFYG